MLPGQRQRCDFQVFPYGSWAIVIAERCRTQVVGGPCGPPTHRLWPFGRDRLDDGVHLVDDVLPGIGPVREIEGYEPPVHVQDPDSSIWPGP
jgi:hypothetical protein